MLYMRKCRTLTLTLTLCVCFLLCLNVWECARLRPQMKYLPVLDTPMDTVKEEQARAREVSRTREGPGLVLEVRARFYACPRQLALTDMLDGIDWYLVYCPPTVLCGGYCDISCLSILALVPTGSGSSSKGCVFSPYFPSFLHVFENGISGPCYDAVQRDEARGENNKPRPAILPSNAHTPTTPTRSPTGSINQSLKRTPITLISEFYRLYHISYV
ncbi:hypothetical protein EDC04DRAFT_2651178, partial [Pisolithus marmoratus]